MEASSPKLQLLPVRASVNFDHWIDSMQSAGRGTIGGRKLMTSTRAEDVAEVLWELKRADKVASLSAIASRAGFSAGSNGRAIKTALKTVRRDWPHLQWWRAVGEEGALEDPEQETLLSDAGYEVAKSKGEPKLKEFSDLQMVWEVEGDEAAEAGESGDE
jgi:alkylated DNA nucleotide flippase Atl1